MAKKKNKDELEAVAEEKTEPAKDEELTPVTDEDDDDEEMDAIVKEAIAEGIALYDKLMEEAKKGPEPELDDMTKELLAAKTMEERIEISKKYNYIPWCE